MMVNILRRNTAAPGGKKGDTDMTLAPESERVESNFLAQRSSLERRVAEGPVEYNTLCPTGKRAAQALKQEALVNIEERDGRMFVTHRKKKNAIMAFLTAGL